MISQLYKISFILGRPMSLDSFLALAEELQLKGLTGTDENESNDAQSAVHIPKIFNEREKSIYKTKNQANNVELSSHADSSFGREVALNSQKGANVDLEQLEEQINSMMEQTENQVTIGRQKYIAMICKVCGKETRKDHMKENIESINIT